MTPTIVYVARFEHAGLLPGFVEAHGHAESGSVWEGVHLGYVDRTDPAGRNWPEFRSIDIKHAVTSGSWVNTSASARPKHCARSSWLAPTC